MDHNSTQEIEELFVRYFKSQYPIPFSLSTQEKMDIHDRLVLIDRKYIERMNQAGTRPKGAEKLLQASRLLKMLLMMSTGKCDSKEYPVPVVPDGVPAESIKELDEISEKVQEIIEEFF